MTARGHQFSMHTRSVWEERSAHGHLPNWLRVAAYAFGMHKANGHANLRKGVKGRAGDLALVLGSVDPLTGEVTPAHRDAVRRAIDTAVEAGFLAAGSHAGCLIVPGHAVRFDLGNPHERCPIDHTAARRKHDRAVLRAA